MTDKQIIPSLKEVMEDEIIVNELKSLYLGIANGTDSDGSIDDWECILADRMSAIINDDLETFEKRWNGRTHMTKIRERLEPSKEELLDYIKWLENHLCNSIWKVGTGDLDKGYYKDWIQNIKLEENEFVVIFDFQGSATEYWYSLH